TNVGGLPTILAHSSPWTHLWGVVALWRFGPKLTDSNYQSNRAAGQNRRPTGSQPGLLQALGGPPQPRQTAGLWKATLPGQPGARQRSPPLARAADEPPTLVGLTWAVY